MLQGERITYIHRLLHTHIHVILHTTHLRMSHARLLSGDRRLFVQKVYNEMNDNSLANIHYKSLFLTISRKK